MDASDKTAASTSSGQSVAVANAPELPRGARGGTGGAEEKAEAAPSAVEEVRAKCLDTGEEDPFHGDTMKAELTAMLASLQTIRWERCVRECAASCTRI